MTRAMKAYCLVAGLIVGGHALGTGLGWFKVYRTTPVFDMRTSGGGGGGGHSGWSGGGFRGGK